MNKHGVDPGPPLRHLPLIDSQSPLSFFFSGSQPIVYQASHLNFDVGPRLTRTKCICSCDASSVIYQTPFVADHNERMNNTAATMSRSLFDTAIANLRNFHRLKIS